MPLTHEQQQILNEVRQRAAELVFDLEQKSAELEKNPPKIDAKQIQEGKAAMSNALAAARKALASIEKAARMAHNE